MPFGIDAEAFAAFLQVVLIDATLSSDNVMIIGLAAAGLPAHLRLRAIWIGVGLAASLLICFALIASLLLKVTGLLFAGGLLLLWVGWKLWRETVGGHGTGAQAAAKEQPKTLGRALWQIVVADVSMSLDNVLAIAGAARDHPTVMVIGFAFSVCLMALASSIVVRLVSRFRWIVYVGLVVIMYVAGKMVWIGSGDLLRAIG